MVTAPALLRLPDRFDRDPEVVGTSCRSGSGCTRTRQRLEPPAEPLPRATGGDLRRPES